ncbi:hypothetical protein [Microcoleus sp. PH2017_14_LAR_D_A]|nr:hypothetical protein [Microcoleus sp. PH2017_14_LAR_D_A]MCC3488204.1 hypothetical protein [Microcoleus sp. PH2017_14_LAR_D_A]
MPVRETSIDKAWEFSTYFFHTLGTPDDYKLAISNQVSKYVRIIILIEPI